MAVIRKRGKSWQVDYRLDGARKRKTFDNKGAAEEFKELLEKKDLMEDLGIAFEQTQTLPSVALKDAIRRYYDNVSVKKESSKNDKGYFSSFYEFLTDKRDVEFIGEVTFEMMEAYQAHLEKQVSPSTVNRQFHTLKNFFNKCVDWEFIEETKNPCRKIKPLKEKPKARRVWSEEEMEKALNALPIWASEIVFFYAMTGARPSEVSNLTWGDVNFAQRMLTLKCEKNAGDGKRNFPISDAVMDQLIRLKPQKLGPSLHKEYVFKNAEGRQFNQDNLQKTFKKLREELGLTEEYVLYGLRHSFGTNLVLQNVSLEKVRVLMGHASITTTQKYMKVKTDELGAELNQKGFTLKLA